MLHELRSLYIAVSFMMLSESFVWDSFLKDFIQAHELDMTIYEFHHSRVAQ